MEGKKTMGYELWEQFHGKLPQVIFYSTGGGVGLIGMCKAFDELEQMGRIAGERPRMVAVQAEGCAPIVKAWEAHQGSAQFFPNAATIASGLRVPGPLGDQLILSMLRQTKGRYLGGAGRGCDVGRGAPPCEVRVDQAAGDGGAVQHRDRIQILGGVAEGSAGLKGLRVWANRRGQSASFARS